MNDFIAYFMLMGALSTGGDLPFWCTSNQWGIYPDSNGMCTLAGVEKPFNMDKTIDWRAGASMALRADGIAPGKTFSMTPMVDQLYAAFRWKFLMAEIGQKRSDLDFYGPSKHLGSLSTTGGSLIFTGNSRELPGIRLELMKVAFPWTKEHLWFWGSIGEYLTLDKRYVKHAGIHRLKLFTEVRFAKHWGISLGIDHYAVFGGDSPDEPDLNFTFKDWLRVLVGASASSKGPVMDQMNVIGDQGGAELIRLNYYSDRWNIFFQHEIPYADKSGMKFQNFPDGVNTFCFSFKDKNRWVSDIVYEFYYTRYQSGPIHDSETDANGNPRPWEPGLSFIGDDDYFNNGYYQSGWTYYGRMMTSPLFFPVGTHEGSWNRDAIVLGTENNRIMAHHIGLGGKFFRKLPYRLMLTYSQNYGRYIKQYAGENAKNKKWGTVKETPLHQFALGLSGEVPEDLLAKGLTLTWGIYGDAGEVLKNNFALSLGLRYSIGGR